MGRGPFQNVPYCLIFSHRELVIDRVAGGEGVGNPRQPEGRRPQVRGLRAGGSPAGAGSTPATQVLSPPKVLKLNHAQIGMVQMQVTPQGWLGSRPEGRRPQVRGFRTGGSLAFARSTPATQLLPPSRMLKLNQAQNEATANCKGSDGDALSTG